MNTVVMPLLRKRHKKKLIKSPILNSFIKLKACSNRLRMNNLNDSLRIPLRILLFAFSLLFAFQTTAQNQEINSYIQKVRSNFGKPDSLKYYGELLISLKDSTAKAEGYFAKAQAMRTLNKLDSALIYTQRALVLVPASDRRLKARILRLTISSYLASRKFEECLLEVNKLEQIATNSNDERLLAFALSMKARAQDGLGDFEKAIKNVLEAARIQEQVDPRSLGNTYSQIAMTYAHMKQPELATPWFQKSLVQARKDRNTRFEVNALNNMASHYHTLKKADSSTYYYGELLKREAQLNPFQKMGTYLSMARIKVEKNQIKDASNYLNKARALNIPKGRANHNIAFLSIEQKIERKKGNYNQAEVLLDSVINMSGNGKMNQINYPFLLEKAELYEEQEHYKKALITFNRYTSIKDSIAKNNDLAVIQNSVDFYQLEEKEADLKLALKDNQTSQSMIVILCIVASFIIIVLVFVYKRYRTSKTREEELEIQHQEIIVSFKKLQDQVAENKRTDATDSILINSKQVVKLDQLEYVKSEGHYLDYFVEGEPLPLTERSALRERINELENSGFLQVHRSFMINIHKVRAIHSGMVIMEAGYKIPLSRTYKQRLKEEAHPLFS
jgi:hypothetical protein